MKLTNLILAAAALAFSSMSFATPQYGGNTYGPTIFTGLGSGATVPAGTDDGYYIWNDIGNSHNWHMRWTSPNQTSNPSWAGHIEINDAANTSLGLVSWDSGDNLLENSFFGITLTATTNTLGNWDGIDFSLTDFAAQGYVLGFNLQTSFLDLDTVVSDPGVASNNIFIGSGYESTNVLVTNIPTAFAGGDFPAGGSYQQFEIKVPEPSIIALFGLGLAGLGFSARRRKMS